VKHGNIVLVSSRRANVLREILAETREGDVLFFYHRTSWRSRWIERITGCEMPHVCVYTGDGQVVGMLRGKVRYHLVDRFVRDNYDLRFVRGSIGVSTEAIRFLGQREARLDLCVIGALVLVERVLGKPGLLRRIVPYRMRGVTCSGVVATAWHRAHGVQARFDPMQQTPCDLEKTTGTVAFFEASFTSRGQFIQPSSGTCTSKPI
jgi:hypothetical protein